MPWVPLSGTKNYRRSDLGRNCIRTRTESQFKDGMGDGGAVSSRIQAWAAGYTGADALQLCAQAMCLERNDLSPIFRKLLSIMEKSNAGSVFLLDRRIAAKVKDSC